MNWQPIKTIPKDGRRVLLRLLGNCEHFSTGSFLFGELKVDLAQYYTTASTQREWIRLHPATHWMPIKGPTE
jgi:hypothetical protein